MYTNASERVLLGYGISCQAAEHGGCSSSAAMSVKEAIDHGNTANTITKMKEAVSTKRRRIDSPTAFMEIEIDPRGKSLKDCDSDKLKDEIKRWAKAVVAYARQC
ncbi:hypothetical protein Nepgr_015943 [Nepenthes gracilis]|uniref:Uncharacterized protein n=1 Tax=Nepenthes gracilis TaxID=150966 RepID=A0AAD3SP56_NEPGR|nr:hypothetical protein Nepgr_015943 [Nepenthes gracilis]